MTDLFRVLLDEGMTLAPSRRNEDALSTNAFDESGNLGRPDLVPVDESEYGSSLVRDGAILAAGASAVLVLVVVAPQVRRIWQEKTLPGLKKKWSGLEKLIPSDESGSQAETDQPSP